MSFFSWAPILSLRYMLSHSQPWLSELTFHCNSGPAPFLRDLLNAGDVVAFPESRHQMCLWWSGVSPARTHTQDTHRFFCRIALMHLKRKMINFWGRRSRTRETQSLNRPQEGFETYFTMTLCSLSAQMTPQDRQGTRNGKIPQHMHRLLVYQLEHWISAPSCNGDCKGSSSQTLTFAPS